MDNSSAKVPSTSTENNNTCVQIVIDDDSSEDEEITITSPPKSGVLSWVIKFEEACIKTFNSDCPSVINTLMERYISCIKSQVQLSCNKSKSGANQLSKEVKWVLNFFHNKVQLLKQAGVSSEYLNNMTELVAMHIDLTIKAHEAGDKFNINTASEILVSLELYLQANETCIVNALLRLTKLSEYCQVVMNPVFEQILFKNLTRPVFMTPLNYCRYILAYRQWKKLWKLTAYKKKITVIAAEKLCPPENFALHDLCKIMCVVPLNVHITKYLLTQPFVTKVAIEDFFNYVKSNQLDDTLTTGNNMFYTTYSATDRFLNIINKRYGNKNSYPSRPPLGEPSVTVIDLTEDETVSDELPANACTQNSADVEILNSSTDIGTLATDLRNSTLDSRTSPTESASVELSEMCTQTVTLKDSSVQITELPCKVKRTNNKKVLCDASCQTSDLEEEEVVKPVSGPKDAAIQIDPDTSEAPRLVSTSIQAYVPQETNNRCVDAGTEMEGICEAGTEENCKVGTEENCEAVTEDNCKAGTEGNCNVIAEGTSSAQMEVNCLAGGEDVYTKTRTFGEMKNSYLSEQSTETCSDPADSVLLTSNLNDCVTGSNERMDVVESGNRTPVLENVLIKVPTSVVSMNKSDIAPNTCEKVLDENDFIKTSQIVLNNNISCESVAKSKISVPKKEIKKKQVKLQSVVLHSFDVTTPAEKKLQEEKLKCANAKLTFVQSENNIEVIDASNEKLIEHSVESICDKSVTVSEISQTPIRDKLSVDVESNSSKEKRSVMVSPVKKDQLDSSSDCSDFLGFNEMDKKRAQTITEKISDSTDRNSVTKNTLGESATKPVPDRSSIVDDNAGHISVPKVSFSGTGFPPNPPIEGILKTSKNGVKPKKNRISFETGNKVCFDRRKSCISLKVTYKKEQTQVPQVYPPSEDYRNQVNCASSIIEKPVKNRSYNNHTFESFSQNDLLGYPKRYSPITVSLPLQAKVHENILTFEKTKRKRGPRKKREEKGTDLFEMHNSENQQESQIKEKKKRGRRKKEPPEKMKKEKKKNQHQEQNVGIEEDTLHEFLRFNNSSKDSKNEIGRFIGRSTLLEEDEVNRIIKKKFNITKELYIRLSKIDILKLQQSGTITSHGKLSNTRVLRSVYSRSVNNANKRYLTRSAGHEHLQELTQHRKKRTRKQSVSDIDYTPEINDSLSEQVDVSSNIEEDGDLVENGDDKKEDRTEMSKYPSYRETSESSYDGTNDVSVDPIIDSEEVVSASQDEGVSMTPASCEDDEFYEHYEQGVKMKNMKKDEGVSLTPASGEDDELCDQSKKDCEWDKNKFELKSNSLGEAKDPCKFESYDKLSSLNFFQEKDSIENCNPKSNFKYENCVKPISVDYVTCPSDQTGADKNTLKDLEVKIPESTESDDDNTDKLSLSDISPPSYSPLTDNESSPQNVEPKSLPPGRLYSILDPNIKTVISKINSKTISESILDHSDTESIAHLDNETGNYNIVPERVVATTSLLTVAAKKHYETPNLSSSVRQKYRKLSNRIIKRDVSEEKAKKNDCSESIDSTVSDDLLAHSQPNVRLQSSLKNQIKENFKENISSRLKTTEVVEAECPVTSSHNGQEFDSSSESSKIQIKNEPKKVSFENVTCRKRKKSDIKTYNNKKPLILNGLSSYPDSEVKKQSKVHESKFKKSHAKIIQYTHPVSIDKISKNDKVFDFCEEEEEPSGLEPYCLNRKRNNVTFPKFAKNYDSLKRKHIDSNPISDNNESSVSKYSHKSNKRKRLGYVAHKVPHVTAESRWNEGWTDPLNLNSVSHGYSKQQIESFRSNGDHIDIVKVSTDDIDNVDSDGVNEYSVNRSQKSAIRKTKNIAYRSEPDDPT